MGAFFASGVRGRESFSKFFPRSRSENGARERRIATDRTAAGTGGSWVGSAPAGEAHGTILSATGEGSTEGPSASDLTERSRRAGAIVPPGLSPGQRARGRFDRVLLRAGLREPVATKPQVFASATESWTDLSIRYLVPARARRKWKSELLVRTSEALARPENAQRILPAYPRRQVQPVSPDGRATDWTPPRSA